MLALCREAGDSVAPRDGVGAPGAEELFDTARADGRDIMLEQAIDDALGEADGSSAERE
jgi:hypothetical protein